MTVKKITIITPCYNAEHLIGETVESIIGQSALSSKRVELEYIICDGNSSDSTVDIITSFKNKDIQLISEPDSGMYDALSKGLSKSTGDIVAYINAGDFYNKYAFDIVLDIFETKNVSWLTGYNVSYSEESYVTGVELPFKYRPNLFACGYYFSKLPAVQQESTFWSSSLHRLIDLEKLSRFKYAGDYYLWTRFSTTCDLKIVMAHLGGFRFHRGQLTTNLNAYEEELMKTSKKPRFRDYPIAFFDKLVWSAPSKIKKRLNRGGIFIYDHELQNWV